MRYLTTTAESDLREFMTAVRTAAKPFVGFGWNVGTKGLRRHDGNSGHWAYFWFFTSATTMPLHLALASGTVSPYLLRVFNNQRVDRAPRAEFIAVHSLLAPLERWLTFEPEGDASPEPLNEYPRRRVLTSDSANGWLSTRFEQHLPKLAELSSDEALLDWLTNEHRSPTSDDLRYAALLARHLRRDDQFEHILNQARVARENEVASAIARGIGTTGYAKDDQTKCPQDWSHDRFLKYLAETPRD